MAWLVIAPLIGFALAGRVFELGADGGWEPWKAAAIGVLMALPFAVGAHFGIRAIRKGSREGWIGAVANSALCALALVMPIMEAVNA